MVKTHHRGGHTIQISDPKTFLQKSLLRENPFINVNNDFSRLDPLNDKLFYSIPRLVYHMDEPAICAITNFYKQSISPGSDILDLCSSWVSHYPLEFPRTMNKICGLGMNFLELSLNDQLTNGFVISDLNQKTKPELPFDDESFDVITCVASIDYWIRPVQVLEECGRILRPGGKIFVSFSNRCFVQKATKVWLNALAANENYYNSYNSFKDMNHGTATRTTAPLQAELVNAFFEYAGDWFRNEPRQVFDITAIVPEKQRQAPVFMIEATKSYSFP